MTPARGRPGAGGRPERPKSGKQPARRAGPPRDHAAPKAARAARGGSAAAPPRARQDRKDVGLGGRQVEGRQAVAELLAANRRRVVDVWIDTHSEPSPILDRITDLAARRRVPIRRVVRTRLEAEARTEAPQGVLAHADGLPEAEFDDLLRARGQAPPFLLALDGVTDPRNFGALLRTAEAAGVTGAFVGRHRAVHVTPAVTKAAAGAVEHVPISIVSGIPAALAKATRAGLWVVGLDPDAEHSLFHLAVADQPIVVVLGAEGKGLAHLVKQRCDAVVQIPLHGTLDALNVSAAGAIALFEVARRRSATPDPLTE